MTRIAYLWIIGGAAAAYAVAVVCWYFASIYGTSARKGKATCAAALLGGSGICIATLTRLVYQWHLPVFEAEGNIGVGLAHSGKHVRTNLLIHIFSGGDIALHASGGSPYFRRGEHVKVRYQGETGAVLRVLFVAAEGREQGVFTVHKLGLFSSFCYSEYLSSSKDFGGIVVIPKARKNRLYQTNIPMDR